jgi:hypothetical protein
MIQLPQLQEALLVASDVMVARSRRRAQRFRLGLMTTAAVATVGGGAVASQGLWGPVVGLDAERAPSVSRAPAPRSQQALLGVLRRSQTAADRSASSQHALRVVSARYRDVRVSDVRRLGPAGTGSSVVLVPVGTVRSRSDEAPQRAAAGDDALCLFVVDAADAAASSCFSEDDVRDGTAWKIAAERVSGVVPDGVASVRVAVPRRGTFDVPVQGNAYAIPLGRVAPGATIAWRHADGSPAPFLRGGPTRALAVPVLTGEMAPNAQQHDCGTGDGGIVPRAVRCGAPARAYAQRKAERDGANGGATERGTAGTSGD